MSREDKSQLIQEALDDGIVTYNNHSLYYECVLCKKPMSGEDPLYQHLISRKHEEVAFRCAISHPRVCPESLKRLLSAEVLKAVEDGTIETQQLPGRVPVIRCKPCNKELNGADPLKQHLKGSDHRKQLHGVQLRVPSFVTGSSNGRTEEARGVTSPLLASGLESNLKLPPHSTKSGDNISSTSTTPVPILTFGNDQRGTPNGTTLLEPSYPRLPETPRLNSTQPPSRETGSVRFPDSLSPVQPISLITTPPIYNIHRRSESTEVNSSSPLIREALPRIGPGAHNLDPSDIVCQAVDDRVLIFNTETLRYTCQVCKELLIHQLAKVHLKDRSHIHKCAGLVVSHAGQGPQSLLDLLPQEVVEAAKASIIINTESNGFRCITCNALSNSVITLKQHLVGGEHLKKNRANSGQPTFPHLNNGYARGTEVPSLKGASENSHLQDDPTCDVLSDAFEKGLVFCTDNNESKYKCHVCSVSLNGLKNLKQHLEGSKHKKQLGNQRRSPHDLLPANPEPLDEPATPNETPLQVKPYVVNSEPRGFVYIFNYKFIGRRTDPKERKGAEKDTVNLMQIFTDMGYEVFPLEDQTAEETRNSIKEITQSQDLQKVDALIMFFLSHGSEPHKFYADDKVMVDLKHDVWDKLTNTSCPAMKDKPKIIFANFCRGLDSEMPEHDAVRDIPRDLVTIHAATEGISAMRNPIHGTHFVRSLCEALRRYASHYDLRTIYEELDPLSKGRGGTQPKWEDERFKKFYFNPIDPGVL